MIDLSPNLCLDVSGQRVLTEEAEMRIREENIRRGQEYRRKLDAGLIKPYTFVDARPGGGIRQHRDKVRHEKPRRSPEARARRAAQLIEKKSQHIPARDHVQARALKP